MLYLYKAFSTFELVTHIWSDKGRLDKIKREEFKSPMFTFHWCVF